MVRAGTPMASEKLRTVQGNSRTTLSLRGAAVLAPVRLMWVFFRVMAGRGDFFLFIVVTAAGGGGFFPLQLPGLATAQGKRTFFFGFEYFFAHSRRRRSRAGRKQFNRRNFQVRRKFGR